ncbi:hypothetical protein AB0I89_24180 [Micromonospora sp. NPDC049801]|uniref:hypothetical protein n=1 Tax=unclassified Micromonospora TaxID=2617518 RepID=UPI00340ED8E9
MTMADVEDEIRRDHETATAALRDLLAETVGGDHAVVDALLPLFEARMEWGVRLAGPDSPSDAVWECDDREGAVDMSRSLSGNPPAMRRLTVRLVGQEWTEVQR